MILNRQIELGDLLLGFEQQRQMSLQTPSGELLLAIAEEPGGLFSGVLLRQLFESSRAFTINVFALDNPSQPTGKVLTGMHLITPDEATLRPITVACSVMQYCFRSSAASHGLTPWHGSSVRFLSQMHRTGL